jgi:hypothetical protein
MTKPALRFSLLHIRILLITNLIILSTTDFLYSQQKDSVDEQDQPWNVSSGAQYYSRYTSYGIDLSEDRPAFSLESEISHHSGISAGVEAFAITGTDDGYENSSFHLGYEYPIDTSISIKGTYTYHSYKTDTLSVLAGISNTLTLGGTCKVSKILFSASYNLFFGSATANYVTAGVSVNSDIGLLTLEPSIQLTYASQTVNQSLLPKNRGKGKGDTKGTTSNLTTTITGLSNLNISMAFHYPLGSGFVASAMPSYVYSPTDLAFTTNQFIVTLGLEHSIDF